MFVPQMLVILRREKFKLNARASNLTERLDYILGLFAFRKRKWWWIFRVCLAWQRSVTLLNVTLLSRQTLESTYPCAERVKYIKCRNAWKLYRAEVGQKRAKRILFCFFVRYLWGNVIGKYDSSVTCNAILNAYHLWSPHACHHMRGQLGLYHTRRLMEYTHV